MEDFSFDRQIIDVLEAVKRTGSISQAADALFLSQPTISKIIRKQEKKYQVEFLDRSGHPLHLTYAGDYFLEQCKRFNQSYEIMQHHLQQFAGVSVGSLTIGVTPSLSSVVLPQILPAFYQRYPHIRLHLLEKTASELEEALLNHAIDLYIGVTPGYHKEFYDRRLFTDSAVLLLPKRLSRNLKLPQIIEDIGPLVNGLDFISEEEGSSFQRLVNAYSAKYNLAPNILVKTAHIATARSLACAGFAATLMPRLMLTEEVRKADLQVISIKPEVFRFDISGTFDVDAAPSEPLINFMNLAQEVFQPPFGKEQDALIDNS
ncbi:LysR family transcriptional regulator [Oenococcus sp.]|uniref:LysR family transcriptional regulator n=1 Tax=Oenococcus sp. TaxID=1979414 RepID=UPI0039ED5E65